MAAADGVTPEQLRDRIARVMPRQVQVETGEEAAQRQTDDIEENLGFLRIALLVFAGVSLFVGSFQIFNTFSITVAQRTREFGMLRTLGASRAPDLLARWASRRWCSACSARPRGLAGGLGFAFGINELFKAVGIDLPNTGTVVEPRTVIVSLDRRRRRDDRGGARPGAARNARHADGGAARGGARGHEEARPGRDRRRGRAGRDRPRR